MEKGGKERLGATRKCTCIDSLASVAPVRIYACIYTHACTRETRIVYRYRYREWRGSGGEGEGGK